MESTSMTVIQPGILDAVPPQGRHLFFTLKLGADPSTALINLQKSTDGSRIVVGFGFSLIQALDKKIPTMRHFPSQTAPGVEIPSTPFALWCWIRDEDKGEILHITRLFKRLLGGAFQLEKVVDTFRYGDGRDLTGYEDGTENPQGDAMMETTMVETQSPELVGSSFAVVQQWVHDLDKFQAMPQDEQDNTIGRRKSDNEELEHAPESAHVKRTAQESFSPEAFMLRRSMPWSEQDKEGLMFVAFAKSFEPFEAQLSRMIGEEDGIIDALFKFTRPISGSYFWCPPVNGSELNLTALGI